MNKEIIKLLLKFLPDGEGTGDEDWNWCWNELGSESQEKVKEVRALAEAILK